MNAIIDYKAIAETNVQALTKSVAEKLKDGWQPFAGITTGQGRAGSLMFCQVLVKYATPAKK